MLILHARVPTNAVASVRVAARLLTQVYARIGVFIGSTLLAVGYRLAERWAVNRRAPATAAVSAQSE